MKDSSIRKSKSYNALGLFLKRKRIINSHALAGLIISKFVMEKNEEWKSIYSEELREFNIIPNKEHSTLTQWRYYIINKEILCCAASFEELKSASANYKCNLFKPHKSIERYIEMSRKELSPERIDKIFDSLKKHDEKFENIDQRIASMGKEINNLQEIILATYPPDTEKRRQIIKENSADVVKCIKTLKQEILN